MKIVPNGLNLKIIRLVGVTSYPAKLGENKQLLMPGNPS